MRFLERFDHFVVPVDDLVAAEDFYLDVLGCAMALNSHGKPMRLGLTVRQQKGGSRPHTFFDVAGRRIGVYLQTDERGRAPAVFGAPTYSFTAGERALERVAAALAARGARFERAEADEAPMAGRSLFFADPAGNNFHIYVPRGAAAGDAQDGRLSGVGYIRLEAPDLDRSIRFYGDVFGLELLEVRENKRLGTREAVLPLANGQAVLLAEMPFAPKGMILNRFTLGPHLAFYVTPSRWDEMIRRFAQMGIGHGDRGAEHKDRRTGERDTYVDDPAGYVLQLVSDKE